MGPHHHGDVMSYFVPMKALIILLLTSTGGSLGGVAYYYQARATSLNNQVSNLNNNASSLSDQIAALKAEIANLTNQISHLQTINGELLDLSSALATPGVRAKDGSALAIDDINSFLASAGCNLKFAASVSDYSLDSSRALSELQAFATAGVQVVLGPLNSGAIQFILSFANANHIVLISPSSTSVALAIPNDFLFRIAPNDRWQGQADAAMLKAEGA